MEHGFRVYDVDTHINPGAEVLGDERQAEHAAEHERLLLPAEGLPRQQPEPVLVETGRQPQHVGRHREEVGHLTLTTRTGDAP